MICILVHLHSAAFAQRVKGFEDLFLQFIVEQRANIRTQKAFEALVSRAPNGMRLPHLRRLVPNLSGAEVCMGGECYMVRRYTHGRTCWAPPSYWNRCQIDWFAALLRIQHLDVAIHRRNRAYAQIDVNRHPNV